MKKLKSTLVVCTLLAGTLGAVASKQFRSPCEDEQQYYKSGVNGYQLVSEDYYCLNGGVNPCTYYRSSAVPLVYTVCVFGDYVDPN